jgi:hypothetical protein
MLVLFLLSMINYGLVSMNYTADVPWIGIPCREEK